MGSGRRRSPTRSAMRPDEPIEHELLRNAVVAEVTVTSTEVSPSSTGDRNVRMEGRLGDDEDRRDGLPGRSVHAHHDESRRGGEPLGEPAPGEEGLAGGSGGRWGGG